MTKAQRAAPWKVLLDTQQQVISRRQARAAGMSEDAWQWLLDTGRWQLLLRGVAAAHSGHVTAGQRAWAAVLSAGDGAALSGDAALVDRGLSIDITRYDVVVPEDRQVRMKRFYEDGAPVSRLTVQAHPCAVAADGPSWRVPQVTVEAAVLQAVDWAPSARAGEWRIAAAVQQRLTAPSALRAALPHVAGTRSELVSVVLDDVELGAHARSELDFLAFLKEHGLPLPDRLQRPVRRTGLHYLDAWWVRQRVAAEVDGAHHRLASTWDADTLRSNDVLLAERHDRVLLLRLTTGNLRHDRAVLARQFGSALR
ncbi:MAG TPA: hypothetical protein VM433_07015 [Mycobacteriales bacterium]|nr:hypothetical protein [Mycobacteriales bacterium]